MEAGKKTKRFIVRPHKIAYGVGVFSIMAAIVLGVAEMVFSVSKIPMWIYLVIGAIFLLGVYVCLEAKNKRLLVEDDILYYSNLFGHMKKFFLKDIGYVRAAIDPAKGQDYLKIYDKEGQLLCRLEWSMQNADELLGYFCDNSTYHNISVEMEHVKAENLPDYMTGKAVCREEMEELAKEVFDKTKEIIGSWKQRNEKLGADFYYGFVSFRGEQMDKNAEIQRRESCCEIKAEEELPADFLCIMEVFIQKDGFFIRDKKGSLLVMDFPIFYKRSTGTIGEDIRLYYNENCMEEIEAALEALEKYLPGHRFRQEAMEPEYELKGGIFK